eukprot:706273-Pleurochrysis_carterae.AAC.3
MLREGPSCGCLSVAARVPRCLPKHGQEQPQSRRCRQQVAPYADDGRHRRHALSLAHVAYALQIRHLLIRTELEI